MADDSSSSSSMDAYYKLIESSLTSLKIPKTHVTVGLANLIASNKDYRTLFVNRRLPNDGWSDIQIQHLLYTLAQLDTNQKKTVETTIMTTTATTASESSSFSSQRWCGVGEREGRVYSNMVSSRHYGLSHGMGRSGDIAEAQPKAVGSTTLVRLTLILVLDAIRRGSGLHAKHSAAHGILLPLCTGMSMALLLSSLRSLHNNKEHPEKRIVLWSRIDQKSCFKAIESAGLQCIIIPTKLEGDAVVTDLNALDAAIHEYGGSDKILAVVTTTSCFAPRVPDQVDQVAKLLKQLHEEAAETGATVAAADATAIGTATATTSSTTSPIYHVINNAYGLQSSSTCQLINRACTIGRVDAIVCSTDKNFLVPVGGAIILSPQASVVNLVGKFYAGRANSSPMVDLFITLLSMGLNGYQQLLHNRNVLREYFSQEFKKVATKHGERLLESCANNDMSNSIGNQNTKSKNCHHSSNDISFGITLDNLARPQGANESNHDYQQAIKKDISSLGAMLFQRCVSGTRVIPRGEIHTIGGQEFVGFGSSHVEYPHAYLTAACAIGLTREEMNSFFMRLDKTLEEFHKKKKKQLKIAAAVETS